jgi:hypothetical protein
VVEIGARETERPFVLHPQQNALADLGSTTAAGRSVEDREDDTVACTQGLGRSLHLTCHARPFLSAERNPLQPRRVLIIQRADGCKRWLASTVDNVLYRSPVLRKPFLEPGRRLQDDPTSSEPSSS